MGAVRVVTDGAADLPAELAVTLDIGVVGGAIHFGSQPWDGTAEEFWRKVAAGGPSPATSPPSIDALASAFAGGRPVCAVHVSAELSRTAEHAEAAASRVACPVQVVDSRSLSVGTGLVAAATAEAVAAGVGFEDLKSVVRRLVERVHVHALLDDATYLVRGGRAGLLDLGGARSGTHHVIAVQGHPVLLRQAKHRPRAVRDLLDHIAHDHVRHGGVARWAVGHGDAPDIDDFVEDATRVFGTPPAFVVLLGASVGTHTGPGALVVGHLSGAD